MPQSFILFTHIMSKSIKVLIVPLLKIKGALEDTHTIKYLPVIESHMEHTLAMQIVGSVALLIGLRMNIDPVGFNKSIFGDVEGIESGESSAMRMAIGGGLLALAMVNIYCSFNIEDAVAGEAILTGTAMGLAAFFVTVAAPKFRGYTDSIPTLPMIVLPTMIAICLYSALM